MKKLFTLENLHLLLGVHIILWLNSGCYDFIGDYVPSAVKMGIVGVWFGLSLIRCEKFFSKFVVTGYLLGFFYLMCLFSRREGVEDYFAHYSMNVLCVLITIMVFSYYFYYGTKEEVKILLIVFLLDVSLLTIRTMIKLQEIPALVRIVSTGTDVRKLEWSKALPKAIGGYGLCYELVLMQPMLSYILNKKKTKTIFKILIYGFILLFLFQAQLTLAFLMYPIVVLVSYTFGQENHGMVSVTRLVLVILGIGVVSVLPALLQVIIESADTHMADRLNEVLGFLTENQTVGSDMQSRLELYTKSWNAFTQSPLWGAFGKKVYGSHSTLLDVLAAYGVAGLTGYFGIFAPIKQTKRFFKEDNGALQMLRFTQLAMVIISIANVLMISQTMLTTLIFMPLTIKYFAYKGEEQSREIVPD